MTYHPITPLGLPAAPPPLPPIPQFVFASLPPAIEIPKDDSFAAAISAASVPGAVPEKEDVRTPVADKMDKKDRRDFFHGDGREFGFKHDKKKYEDWYELGSKVELGVEDVHFGNPRVRIMTGEPAPMPTMLKWSEEEFMKHEVTCAQISFGDAYRVWCAVGIPANRLLYAMKRNKVEKLSAVVVEPPPL